MWSSERKVLFVSWVLSLAACQKGAEPTNEGSTAPEGTEGAEGAEVGEPGESPPGAPGNCAVTTCLEQTYCDDAGGQAKCIPLPSCAAHSCPEGQHCELVEVQCVRAPCPPQPACLAHEHK